MPSGWPRVILWCLLVLTRNQRCSAGSALSRHGLARWVKLAELRRLVDLGCVRGERMPWAQTLGVLPATASAPTSSISPPGP